jgi:putative peptide zinc metalloprotease protein
VNAAAPPLPALREDLRLHEVDADADGSPAWVIEDPVVNRFFRIGWFEFECLLRWKQRDADRIAVDIAQATPMHADVGQIHDFARFMAGNHLLRPDARTVDALAARYDATPALRWRWWLHHYLFFRIPLLRPQYLLEAAMPYVSWIYTRAMLYAVIAAGLLGLFLVGRQWDVFTKSFVETFSSEGLVGFALALTVAKTCHELGHAFTATRQGLKVAHMGLAFLVMWPVLYTDTGQSWKLRSRRQRLAIASAGVITELGIACLATLAWALLEPGGLRNGLFYLASSSWMLSLALNASPFMRFDGYFMLSDLLDMPNLHERAGTLARTCMRRHLLGWDEPYAEHFPPRRHRLLIGFAFVTWAYRFIVFTGIAVAVYLFFFKALAIVLFAVEIGWFVIGPALREFKVWYAGRERIRIGRKRIALVVGLLVAALLILPVRGSIHGVGVLHARDQQQVFAPFGARVVSVRARGVVAKGEVLAQLDAPDIQARRTTAETGERTMSATLAGLPSMQHGMDRYRSTQEQLQERGAEVRSASGEIARLVLRADNAGAWSDTDATVQAGSWVGSKQELGTVYSPGAWVVDAYVSQGDIARIEPGDAVSFYTPAQTAALAGHVIEVDGEGTRKGVSSLLSGRYGGPLPVAHDSEATLEQVQYRVRVALDGAPRNPREQRGDVVISGERHSVALDGLRKIAAVVIREGGF